MMELREQIESLRLTGDSFRNDAPGDTGERDAVARESLQVINMRREPPEIRRATHCDVDVSSPRIFNACIGELRKHLHHPLASCARRVECVRPRIADSTTEQEAMVRGASEVSQHKVDISDGNVFAHESLHA